MNKKLFLSLNFRRNIYLLFAISILIPVLLITLFFSIFYGSQAIRYNNQRAGSVLFSAAKSIEIHINELERISFTPYLYRDILSAMVYMKNGFLESSPDYLDVNRFVDNYSITFIKMLHSSANPIHKISFYPVNASEEYFYEINRNSPSVQTVVTEDYTAQSWFQNTLKSNGDIVLSPFYTDAQGGRESVFSLTRLIRDSDSKKNIGVMRIDASARTIEEILDNVVLTKNSGIVLLDQDNTLIYSTLTEPEPELLQAARNGNLDALTSAGKYSLVSQTVDKTGWRLVYLSSNNDIILSNSSTFLLAFVLGLSTLAAAFIVYYKRSAKMVHSVDSIIHTIHELQKGNLSAKCVVEDEDEFAMIGDALGKMGEKLQSHIEKEYMAVINQRNAEYIALQSQINPHFLYNTLTGFIALNRMGERDLLEQNIIQLTRLFRYTCKNSNLSTVAEELDFVLRYLELQKLRFEERFEYDIHIEPEAAEVTIPKLLVQPIVENCLIHGMEPCEHPIFIQVTARLIRGDNDAPVLELLVEDDGTGFDQSTVQSDSSHVGVANIMERVRFFHARSTFELESSPGKGTTCRICIPQNKQGRS